VILFGEIGFAARVTFLTREMVGPRQQYVGCKVIWDHLLCDLEVHDCGLNIVLGQKHLAHLDEGVSIAPIQRNGSNQSLLSLFQLVCTQIAFL